MKWEDFVFSDVTRDYVSAVVPKLKEVVFVRLRLPLRHPVKKVLLWTITNGDGQWLDMHPVMKTKNFEYFQGELVMNQPEKHYRFVLFTPESVLYYNRAGMFQYPPTEDHDFVLLAQDDIPDWVGRRTFYHIFPDRFARGGYYKLTPYVYHGYEAMEMPWDQKPKPYEEAGCLDFYMGDLDGIRQRIPYLQELGVGAVYLNPIFQAPTTHRYDCVDYTRVDEKLGGNTALIRLVEALHEADIKIILDISINHTGKNHHWFQKALADPHSEERSFYYFDEKGNYLSWYNNPILPQLNYNSQRLRDLLYRLSDSVLQMYLRPPYNIDGWRFDVGNQTARRDGDQMGHEVFQEIRQALKAVKKDAYLLGEHWEDTLDYHKGNEWDGAMNYFACLRPLRSFAGEADHFLKPKLPHDFQWPKASGEAVARQIFQHYTRLPNSLTTTQFNLIDSHDIGRFHTQKDIFNKQWYRGMISLGFLLPGAFSIYYGDEILLDGDPTTIEGCRYPMQWDDRLWDKEVFSWYQRLAHWKKDSLALQEGSFRLLQTGKHHLVVARFTMQEAWVLAFSNGNEEEEIAADLSLLGVEEDARVFSVWDEAAFSLVKGVWRTKLPPMGNCLVRLALQP